METWESLVGPGWETEEGLHYVSSQVKPRMPMPWWDASCRTQVDMEQSIPAPSWPRLPIYLISTSNGRVSIPKAGARL